MKKISELWAMAYDNYIDAIYWTTKTGTDYITKMEDTLMYWWPKASCEELYPCYNHLQQKIKARKRLPK